MLPPRSVFLLAQRLVVWQVVACILTQAELLSNRSMHLSKQALAEYTQFLSVTATEPLSPDQQQVCGTRSVCTECRAVSAHVDGDTRVSLE